jgi:periplasmic protein TonB
MKKKVSIYSDAWCDMVFEMKNKDYGAFLLRKISTKSHALAVLVTAIVFSLSVSAPLLIKGLTKSLGVKDVEVVNLTKFKIEKPIELPKIDEIKPVKQMIRFTPFLVRPDDDVTGDDQIMTNDDLLGSKLPIGGDDDSADIKDLVVKKNIIGDPGKIHEIYDLQQLPEFPGGEEEMLKFIKSNVVYPGPALAANIQGTVYVKFVITNTGKVSDVQVLRGVEGGCSEEAARVVKMMPDWKPGKQNGLAVPVYFNLPINFVLKN